MNPGAISMSREGDDYVYTWPNTEIVLVFTEPRERQDDLWTEITVYEADEDGERYHLTGPSRYNLLSSRSRPDFAKMLAMRVSGSLRVNDDIDFDTMAEQAFGKTIYNFRQGSTVYRLEGPLPETATRTALVDPLIIANETTMIYANGDSGKSYLALFCALSLGLGIPLAGGRLLPTEQKWDTLYLDWETKRDMVWRRWDRICRGAGLEHSLGTLSYQQPQRALSTIGAEVRRRIHEADQYAKHEGRAGLGLVVVDAISMAVGTDLIGADAATALFNTVNTFPCAVLLLHHMSKESIKLKRGQAEAYGTIFFHNATRNSWELRTDDYGIDDRVLGLEHHKANEGVRRREPLVLHMHFDGREGPVTLDAGRAALGGNIESRRNLVDRVLDVLRGGAKDVAEIASLLDMSGEKGENAVRTTLNRLKDRGQVMRLDGEGKKAEWGLALPGGGLPTSESNDPMSRDVPF